MINTYSLKVKEIVKETPSIFTLSLEFMNESMEYKIGQYIIVQFEDNGKKVSRMYSIASTPEEPLKLCVKLIENGKCSNFLSNLQEGDKVLIKGPLGRFVLHPTENNLVFIAAGSGIAPIRPMILDSLKNSKTKVWLFFGNKTEEEITFNNEFFNLKKKFKNFKYIPVLSEETKEPYKKGHVQDFLKSNIKQYSEKDYYICGVGKMVLDVEKHLLLNAVKKSNIHYERYT